jgi:hypothetical protein
MKIMLNHGTLKDFFIKDKNSKGFSILELRNYFGCKQDDLMHILQFFLDKGVLQSKKMCSSSCSGCFMKDSYSQNKFYWTNAS